FVAHWGYSIYKSAKDEEALVAHQKDVETNLAPMTAKMVEDSRPSEPPPADKPAYDIDKTVRVIHEIDEAVKESKDLKSYIEKLGKQDYRNVAPDVLA